MKQTSAYVCADSGSPKSHNNPTKLDPNSRQVYSREIGEDNRDPWDSTHYILIRASEREISLPIDFVSLPIFGRGSVWLLITTAFKLTLCVVPCRSWQTRTRVHIHRPPDANEHLRCRDNKDGTIKCTFYCFPLSTRLDAEIVRTLMLFSMKQEKINPRLVRTESPFASSSSSSSSSRIRPHGLFRLRI
jgi:hypothetical protein